MKRNWKKLLVGSAGLFLLAVAVFTNRPVEQKYSYSVRSLSMGAIPTELMNRLEEDESENPIERLEFEMGQLVDPRTGRLPENIYERELEYAKTKLSQAVNASPSSVSPFSFGKQAKAQNSQNFINVGPYNIGGRTRAVVIDATDENIIVAGGIAGGVWKSTDQGQTWARKSGLQQHPAITSIVQDTRTGKTNEWYYSTGEFTGNSASASGAFYLGNGIYKSTDGGETWSLIQATAKAGTSESDVVTSTDRFSIIHQLAIDKSASSGTEIYAAGLSEIIRSTDGFETFEVVLGANNTGNNFSDVAVSSSGKVYAAIANSSFNGNNREDGFYKSDDGLSWTKIQPPSNFPSSFDRFEIAIDPNDENKVYFVSGNRLFAYNESANFWTDLSANINVSTGDVGAGHGSQGGYDLYAAVHPSDPNVIFLGGVNLIRSTNGFGTTAQTKQVGGYNNDNNPNSFPRYPNHHPDNHAYAFFPSNPNRMISATDGGLHLTENNKANVSANNPITWKSLNNGYITTQFYHADIHQFDLGDPQLAGGMQDNGTWAKFTSNAKENWVEVFGGDGAFTAINYNSIFASSQRGNLIRYELQGNEYNFVGNISPTDNDSDYLFVNPYHVNPVHQDQVFVAARGRVFFTNDVRNNPGEGQWSTIINTNLATQQVSALDVSFQPEGVLYFGTRQGGVYKVANTKDLADQTEAQLISNGLPFANISGIAVDPQDADKVIVTYSNYGLVSVWYTENGGQSWHSISGNLEENPDGSGAGPSVRAVEIMPDGAGGNYYFVGTSVGLYMTKALDGDNTVWTQQASQSIGNVVVANIVARPVEGMIMVSTHGNGCFYGYYDVEGVVANINYSVSENGRAVTLRGNISYNASFPMSYQWLRNGQEIDGANSAELTVAEGGDYQLRLGIQGVEGTGLSNVVSLNLDGQAPKIVSINRFNPATEATDGTSVEFEVTFDEEVINISADDFETTGTASGVVDNVAVVTAGQVFRVTVRDIGGSGTLGLGVAASNDIEDTSGNAFAGTIESEQTYTITDVTAPGASLTRNDPGTEVTNQNTVSFTLTFTENVQNMDISDLELSSSAPSAEISELLAVTGTRVFTVTVSNIAADGVIDINFVSSQDVQDLAGNDFDGSFTQKETYTIENVIASIDNELIQNATTIVVDANPSNGVFHLVLPRTFSGAVSYQVIDAQGRSVTMNEVKQYQRGAQIRLDLRSSADGVYIFEAVNANRKASVKLLKRSR
ncbi:T9SS type A sorting domain-containing protein [Roseivirga sp. UBA1976]|uniref:T9SS type A sorting domain-containing protein n=1 Tax=Roseivirga sp. UBA1976 TaxID=1947386 RepID=UPI00257A4FA2|nr:T9SS type A sorting domain-containing protein [Roseivirga sp. UBA1976]MEC7754253.1 T9SS type A sorting domain-containing protein [Bacteroidota bacterium]|tara:strand:- start:1148 stop:4858 length:3711 start_codon:yes stop_codon:yes gene_type:complete